MKKRSAAWQMALASLCAALIAAANGLPDQAAKDLCRRFEDLPRTFGQINFHQPQAGESTFSVARKFGISLRSLARANPRVSPGAPLLIPTLYFPPPGEPGELVLNLAERVAYLYDEQGRPAAVYPIAIGQIGWETPVGDFTIIRRGKNPTWFPPSWAKLEHPVPPGPENPLGDRWMGLSVPGYGLHATNSPPSVGRAVSHGCIRLYPEDAHALYDRLKIGSRVRIIYETLLLGYSPSDRAVYISVHPDIYSTGTNRLSRARILVWLAGLDGFVEEGEIRQLLTAARGVPVPLLGSNLRLRVNGDEICLPINPTPKGDDYLVPALPLIAALGASLSENPQNGWFLLQRGERWFAFTPGSRQAWMNRRSVRLSTKPVLLNWRRDNRPGRAMLLLPLSETCDALGASMSLDQETHTLQITDPFSPPGGAIGFTSQVRILASACGSRNPSAGCAALNPDMLSLVR